MAERSTTGTLTSRRHECEVTADRLLEHVEKYFDKFDGAERDDLSRVRNLLLDIAEGTR